MSTRLAFFAVVIFVSGCCGMCAERTVSENVRTEGIHAEMSAYADDRPETRVSVTLRAGGPLSNLYLDVAGGDRLEATNGGASVALTTTRHTLGPTTYDGTLPGNSGGRPIEIRFLRTTATSAVDSRILMPASFAITAPAEDEAFSRAKADVTVGWSPPAAGSISWTAEGDCILARHGMFSDDSGRGTISLEAVPPADGGGGEGACPVTITLRRDHSGNVDQRFGEGGTLLAQQSRRRTVRFTP